jgi:hypothetical protein
MNGGASMITCARRDRLVKPLVVALLLLGFFLADGCSSPRGGRTVPPLPPPPPAPPPEHAPAAAGPPAPPQPESPLDPVRTLALEEAMERVSDAGLEGSLEEWANGKEANLDHVAKRTGVFLEVAPKAKWEAHEKRARNPADFDRLVRESIMKASALVAAAREKRTDAIKPLSDALLQACVDCHTRYK